ncbi:MAG: peroxiredoxin family protein [Microcoleus sp.]
MKFLATIGILIVSFVGLFTIARLTTPATNNQTGDIYANLMGKTAPSFELPSYNGTTVSLSSLRGKKVILFFNEGIVCYPACWNQVAALGTDKDLNNDRVATASIVPDQQSDWATAVKRQPDLGKETILLDSNLNTSQSYGMMSLGSSMHKGVKPGHTYVIIDQKGVVRYVYDDPTMGIQNDRLKQEINKL